MVVYAYERRCMSMKHLDNPVANEQLGCDFNVTTRSVWVCDASAPFYIQRQLIGFCQNKFSLTTHFSRR